MICQYFDENGTNGIYGTNSYILPLTSQSSGIQYIMDFSKLLFNIIPHIYRPYKNGTWNRLKLFKFIQIPIANIQAFFDFNFLEYRANALYMSNITAQTLVLEKYLRDLYQNCGIRIQNNYTQADVVYIYRNNEIGNSITDNFIYRNSETALTTQLYLYNSSEVNSATDCTIFVPQQLVDNNIVKIPELTELVKKYIYVTTIFDIKTY